MLYKNLTNIIQNLGKKKFRIKYNLFKAEGEKIVNELLLSNLTTDTIIAKNEWIKKNSDILNKDNIKIIEATNEELKSISNFQSYPDVIALAKIPSYKIANDEIKSELSILLNGVQDPGNLGTIIRLADWFGIKNIFCDTDCAGIFNPKCVQASMGAVLRVKIHYVNLINLIKEYKNSDFHCYGAFLEGKNIYESNLSKKGFIIMGNEGKGISNELSEFIDKKITIPSFANAKLSTESLNVSIATGIILSEFKRR